ncbi:MAG TPA: protein-export chaperone SecB [Thermodesulfovibrionales bacterium]|nr:protein-export chaperone SecB [Thermodesulfovibrionales bacterium]
MNLQFSIADIRLIDAHFTLKPNFNFSAGKPVSINSSFDIQSGINGKIVNVVLNVSSTDDNQPFTYRVSLLGRFQFKEIPTNKILDKIVHVNCAAILFPYMREFIADLTRRAGVPPFNLAPVNLVKAYNDKVATQQGKSNIEKRVVKKPTPLAADAATAKR